MGHKKIKKITQKNIRKTTVLIFVALFLFYALQDIAAQTTTEDILVLKIDDLSKNVPYSEYSKWFSFHPSLSIDKAYRSEIENINFCYGKNVPCDLFLTQRIRYHTKKNIAIYFETEKVETFLEKLSQETDKAPINAKFKMENDRASVFVADEKGRALDIKKSLEIISSILQDGTINENDKEIILAYSITEPEITAKDVNDLGINTLIGEGKSNFKGSTKSRMHNIRVATSRYDGFLLAPGEEFSFVTILGPVDGEHGYLPELVIKHDKTEPEFGGGICQVSTTAFRAAIYSGLEITDRKNHAYPVQYYNPQGMDATIYIPKPDLKFKNNTSGYILFQTKIEGTELTFSLYGTDDGRKIEVDGPHILERRSDGSMRTVFIQKVLDKAGKEIIKDTFNSFYDSPNKYPHPSEEKFTKKPRDWSNKQWELYKKVNGL